MNLFQIKAFCAVADRGSFTEASNDLYVSTSCLSKTIHSLETELDTALFNRERNKVTLTPAGLCFCEYARKSMDDHANMLRQLAQFQPNRKNHLRISLTTSHRYYSLLAPIKGFQSQHPDLSISIFEFEKDTVLKKLESNEVDLAISWDGEGHRVPSSEYDVFYFLREKRVLLCNSNHPLAERKSVTIDDLRDYAFVMPDNMLQRSIYANPLEKQGFTPTISAYYNSITTQYELIEQNFGISFGLERTAATYRNTGICTVDFSPPIYNNLAVIQKKSMRNKLTQSFIEYYLEFMRKKYSDPNFE